MSTAPLNTFPSSTGRAPSLARVSTLHDQYRLDPDDPVLFHKPQGAKRKVSLAVFLLVLGIVLLSVGLSEYFKGTPGGVPMIVIGSVAFLPGFFYTRLAYLAWQGRKGFNMQDIPEV